VSEAQFEITGLEGIENANTIGTRLEARTRMNRCRF